jgi:O-antigen ligase
MYCVVRLRPQAVKIYAPLVSPVACALTFIGLQVLVHDESLMDQSLRQFVIWMLGRIVVQSLVQREGFLHRFGRATFFIGLTLVPYMSVYVDTSEFQRAGLDSRVGYHNPNDLAAWFGFCCVYFATVGFEARRNVVRVTSWIAAATCLFVVGITVSRGTLAAVGIGIVLALRRSLKRGFLPLLCLGVFCWILLLSGLFEQTIAFYSARSSQDTGRLRVWPLAFERFLDSPLAGVGVANVATDVPGDHPITPHNSFLFLALASGVVPLTFFLAYWFRAARRAIRLRSQRSGDAPFLLPLLIYSFLVMNSLADAFMFPWAMVTLSVAMASTSRRRALPIPERQTRRDGTVGGLYPSKEREALSRNYW